MKIYDCSRFIRTQMPLFPGNQPPEQTWMRRMADGGKNNVSVIKMGSHTGTHTDAPSHFIQDGKTLDEFGLNPFVGYCRVADVGDVPVVTEKELRQIRPEKDEILILKTRNSDEDEKTPFHADYTGLDKSAAQYLVSCGVRTVGIDYLSVEDQSPDVIHSYILGAQIGIIEGLYLKDVPEGRYFLCAAPIKVEGAEGAPCRAILIDFEA